MFIIWYVCAFAEDVNSMGVRFRLYGCERMRRERMIGECVVSFTSINLELETTMWVALEPRANLAVSILLRTGLTQLSLFNPFHTNRK
jgi:hypothetical protein